MTEVVPAKRGRGRPKAPKPVAKAPVGRPRYVPASEQKALVERLVAVGESHDDIGKLLGISQPVFRDRFKAQIADGRLKLRAALMAVIIEKALDGNASMLKLAMDLTGLQEVEKPYELPVTQTEAPVEEKPAKLGKKEQQALAAANPDTATKMGKLMAARAQGTKTVQ